MSSGHAGDSYFREHPQEAQEVTVRDNDDRSDSALVAAVLDGDNAAFAEVYQRYVDRLYDFAAGQLRNRDEAFDAVADAFVLAAERITQLRDPDLLRPWLYSIVRNECRKRLRARSRVAYDAEDQLMRLADQGKTPEEQAQHDELAALVWDAAAGLAARDRALLDLHLRHGLEGAELGEAMGMSAGNAYTALHRLRGQVERSLGALLVARLGRRDCAELETVLTDWDGRFSPLWRKRVARHVDACEVCTRRRSLVASPLALLGAVPILAAPQALRSRVLEDPRLVAALSSPRSGAPVTRTPSTPAGHRRRATAITAGVAATVVTGVVVSALLLRPDTEVVRAVDAAVASTSDTTVSSRVPRTEKPSVPSKAPPASPNRSPAPSKQTTPAVEDQTVTTAPPPASLPPTVEPPTVEPPKPVPSDGPDPASPSTPVPPSSPTTPTTPTTPPPTPPVIGTPVLTDGLCSTGRRVTVSVPVTDDSGVDQVALDWSTGAVRGTAPMTQRGDRWYAGLGPFPGGPIDLVVTAVDDQGNRAQRQGSGAVTPCPG
ncbi:hypothetical protein GCM10027020_23670 [Nocardioides salsibiostraticola]